MPKDPPTNAGSNSRSHVPYPSPFRAQGSWIGIPRSGTGLRNSPNAIWPPSSHNSAVGVALGTSSATLTTVSPRSQTFAQLPCFYRESPVYSPLGLSVWGQRAPPCSDPTGCLPPPPPHTPISQSQLIPPNLYPLRPPPLLNGRRQVL